MEQLFKTFQQGKEVKKHSSYYEDYKKDINKMFNMGILIKDKVFKINPLVAKSKSLTTAKLKIKQTVSDWLDNLDRSNKIQMDFRSEMVEYFKENPIGSIHNMYAHMGDDTPDRYKSGSGYAYVMNGEIISLHLGFTPPSNAPTGCDRFKYESQLGMIKLSV